MDDKTLKSGKERKKMEKKEKKREKHEQRDEIPRLPPAGVDPNLEAKRGRGSTRGERHQGDATGVTSSVSSSAPMVFTVQALLSLLSRRYVR